MSKALKARNQRVKAMIKRGHATGNEVIEALFGEMPKGLHQDTPINDVFQFDNFVNDPNGKFYRHLVDYGYVNSNEPQHRIYFNHMMMRGLGKILGVAATRLALGRVHDAVEVGFEALTGMEHIWPITLGTLVATMASSYRFVALSSITKALNPSYPDILAEEFVHSLAIKGPDGPSWLVQNSFRANAWNMQKRTPSALTTFRQYANAIVTMMPTGYYKQDQEIAGRMLALAVRGYLDGHGKIAENPDEALAFFKDMGVKTPWAVRVYLNDKQFEGLRRDWNKHDDSYLAYLFPPSAEINIGISSYKNGAVMEMYWKDAFQVMFAEMRKLLGDSQALPRFGYSSTRTNLEGVPQPLRPDELDTPKITFEGLDI